jgi:bile acid:Na+ symporter, BASS family
MNEIDLVKVNFNPNALIYLNVLLGFLMFGVALDIKIADFKHVLKQPKAVFLGLMIQYIIFPAATMLLIYTFNLPTSVALGMVLVSACPSGNMANYMAHRANANITLSVSLNAIIALFASVSTPLVYSFWSAFVPNKASLGIEIVIPFVEMIKIITVLIVIPLVLGIFLSHFYPTFVSRIKKTVSILSLVIFFGFIIAALVNNWYNVVNHLHKVFFIVLLHNAFAIFVGYYTGKIFKLDKKDCQTLALESSIHNTALGLILIFNFFGGLGGMAMIAAWYGIWDLIVPFMFANYWRKNNV